MSGGSAARAHEPVLRPSLLGVGRRLDKDSGVLRPRERDVDHSIVRVVLVQAVRERVPVAIIQVCADVFPLAAFGLMDAEAHREGVVVADTSCNVGHELKQGGLFICRQGRRLAPSEVSCSQGGETILGGLEQRFPDRGELGRQTPYVVIVLEHHANCFGPQW